MDKHYSFDSWAMVAIGDVVRQVRDRVKNPGDSGIKQYLPGGGISADRLTVDNWCPVDDGLMGPAFEIRFHPGHTLYKSRVPHGVGVADRIGICSNTTFVLEPINPTVLLPEFLPYILITDAFRDFERRNNKGSTNLFLNFSDIVRYEFALPSLEDQRRLLEVLEAGRLAQETLEELKTRFDMLLHSKLIESYSKLSAKFDRVNVESFGEAAMGRQKAPKFRTGANPFPYLSVANVGSLELKLGELQEMDFNPAELEKFRLITGDILLTEGDLVSEFNVGRPAIFLGEIEDCCFQNTLLRLRPHPYMDPMFVLGLLEGARLHFEFAKASKTTTVTHLGLGRFKEVMLPMPDESAQSLLANELSLLLNARSTLRGRLSEFQRLNVRLLSGVFE